MEHVKKERHSLLILFCIYIVAIVVGVITVIIIPDSKVYSIIFYAVVMLGIIKYIKQEKYDWRKWFSKIEEGVGRIILMILVVALLLVVNFLLQIALCYIGEAEPFQFNIFVYIATGLLAPVMEEIVCRGIIVDILQEKHKSVFVVIVSSLIFYVIHGNPINIGAFIFGIFASFTVLKTKNIMPGMIVHLIWNQIIYFLPLIGQTLIFAFKV
ncbi:MAG: CPBP family intramembrane metalloprotease [Lachnospiraceae bacterium]|nr:CPBP family intramembrane metalloprotease [Lachnospiraceae bacterium]